MTAKTAIVTGGSRGLGKEIALRIADKGLHVILTYKKNRDEAEGVVQEIRSKGLEARALPLDMSDISALPGFVEQVRSVLADMGLGSFDYLVNNAGMGATVAFEDVTEQLFDEFLNVHYKGVYFLTQQLLPLLNDGGAIINISSGTTRYANPGYSVYASMKGAIEVLTRYFAKELGARGIRSNVVAPGPVETDFNNGAIRNNPELKKRLSGLSPLGRVGSADDIGGVVAFLCSEEARWINAQRIEVSGGINT